MNPDFLGPLATVDLHDPLGPLDDRESFFQWCSKKSNSLKKRKGIFAVS